MTPARPRRSLWHAARTRKKPPADETYQRGFFKLGCLAWRDPPARMTPVGYTLHGYDKKAHGEGLRPGVVRATAQERTSRGKVTSIQGVGAQGKAPSESLKR